MRIYTIDDCEFISVTSVLDLVSKGEMILDWAAVQACNYLADHLGNSSLTFPELLDQASKNYQSVKNEACDIGSQVHHLIEQNIKGIWVDIKGLRPEVRNGFLAFLKWKRQFNVKFIHSELQVVSKKHCYAGTLDAIISIGGGGQRLVVDWKTSGAFHDTFPLQVCAYQEAAREMRIQTDGVAVVRFDKYTGAFEFQDYTKGRERHLNSWLKLLDFFYAYKQRRLRNNPRASGAEFKAKARMVA